MLEARIARLQPPPAVAELLDDAALDARAKAASKPKAQPKRKAKAKSKSAARGKAAPKAAAKAAAAPAHASHSASDEAASDPVTGPLSGDIKNLYLSGLHLAMAAAPVVIASCQAPHLHSEGRSISSSQQVTLLSG